MASLVKQLYWCAPYPVKCWMASLYARKWDALRHGPHYDEVLEQIAERDRWTTERLLDYQTQRLGEMVRHAGRQVPYYRRLFAEVGLDPERFSGPEDLVRLPILGKNGARVHSVELIDERLDPRNLIVQHTSGTTGTPLDFYRDARQESTAFAFYDGRCREQVGMRRRRNRSVNISGSIVTPVERRKPPFWVYNARWDQLNMSCYHMSEEHLGYYVEEMRRFGADFVEGYPSTVYAVARFIVDHGLDPIPFQACFTTGETLFDFQREAIRRAFLCRTISQLGCGEMAIFAAECEHGTLHLSPDYAFVEAVDRNGRRLPPGEQGSLVGTSLVNWVQPFIRYRIGDIGAPVVRACPCGRPLPVLDHFEGRIEAVLIMRDGRWMGRLDAIFKGASGFHEAQIIQDDFERFRIRLVPAEEYREADGQLLVDNLHNCIGHEVQIRLELVDRIERAASGKFPAVLCNLPEEIKRRGPDPELRLDVR